MLTWNTDRTDVDLHVREPSGEECFYQHTRTRSGGWITADVTTGFGPEMYVLPSAPRGRYAIRAHYFAADQNRASTRSKVYVTVVEHWGRPDERVTERIVTLRGAKELQDLLELRID
jgi:uncharacterized protein YfaP (DUF2135 family)